MTTVPPRFVPTLTDIVQPSLVTKQEEFRPTATDFAAVLEDQIIHRVMQHVDLVLEQRLSAAITQVTLPFTQALGLRLREEIESVVRTSVSEAIAHELPAQSV